MNMEEESEIVVTSAAECLEYVEKKTSKMTRSLFLSRIGVTVLTYPLDFVKTLMQIGYEPMEPVSSVTLLGRRCLLLPNSLEYVKYVKQVDGIAGCFRGLGPRLAQHSVLMYSSHLMRQIIIWCHYGSGKPKENDEHHECPSPLSSDMDASFDSDTVSETSSIFNGDGDLEENVSVVSYLKAMCEDWCCRMFGIVVSFPFQVIAVRTIAEFVGRESNFSCGILQGILQIYQQDGLLGFFKGLLPKLVGDSIHVVSCGVIRYMIRAVCCEELRACMNFSMSVCIGSLTYPFIVISNTMIVSGAGYLAVGNPPFMDAYKTWLQCWNHLSGLNQLRRGSSLFFRYYTGPCKMLTSGKSVPLGIKFGPDLRKLTF